MTEHAESAETVREMDVTIEQIRAEVDATDRTIVALIATLQQWVEAAGRLKRGEPLRAVQAPERVASVIEVVRQEATVAGASPDVVETTYRAMIEAFIRLESEVHASGPEIAR